jgi:hypothetical protein
LSCQVLHGPSSVNMLNLLFSLVKYGWADCYGGAGTNQVGKYGWDHTRCEIGDSTNWGENTYNPGDYGLTSADDVVEDLSKLLMSGRLSDSNRQHLKQAYDFTISEGKSQFEAMINVQQLMVATPEFHTTNIPFATGNSRSLPQTPAATGLPYKTVILVMLSGGADSYNMLVPDVCSGTNEAGIPLSEQYLTHRGSMAFDRSQQEFDLTISASGQPCSQFALHDELVFIKELYDDSDLIWVANSGVVNQNGVTKSNLYTKVSLGFVN